MNTDLVGDPIGNDISIEVYRTYVYADGGEYTISRPKKLYIADSGGHRVVDSEGVTHAPSRPWVAIKWEQTDGKPYSF